MNHDLLGLAAGTLTTVAFIPQVVKIWRTRHAADISLIMFLLFATGVLLWLLYGIAIHSLPIVVANGITLTLAVVIIVLKLKFEREARATAGSSRLRRHPEDIS